ncbi:MAG: hypothetical protein IJB33_06495 [Akkermansia sp.]|nr:hypothetical protein [Akkermansia sp.]
MNNSNREDDLLSLEEVMPLWLRRLMPRWVMRKAVCRSYGPVLQLNDGEVPEVTPVFSAVVLPEGGEDDGRVLKEAELLQKKVDGALPEYGVAVVKCKMVDEHVARQYVRKLLSTESFADNGLVVLLRGARDARPVVGVSTFRMGVNDELMRICVVPPMPGQMKPDVRRLLKLAATCGKKEAFIRAWCAALCCYDLKDSPIFRGMRFKWLNMTHPQAPQKVIMLYMARLTIVKHFRKCIQDYVEDESCIFVDEYLLANVATLVDNLRNELARC